MSGIMVVGDVMVDEYVDGVALRLSQEAPVPILERSGHYYSMGGAANVARNLIALGRSVTLMGVIGYDTPGHWLRQTAEKSMTSLLIYDRDRPSTTLKTRFRDRSGHQLLRVDSESREPSTLFTKKLLEYGDLHFANIGAIIVSDYGKGVVTEEVAQFLITQGKKRGIPVVVDPKTTDFTKYRGATIIKPNEAEMKATREKPQALATLADAIVETNGDRWVVIHINGQEPWTCPVDAVENANTIGAGDAFIAAMTHFITGKNFRASIVPMNVHLQIAIKYAIAMTGKAVTRRVCSILPGDDQ